MDIKRTLNLVINEAEVCLCDEDKLTSEGQGLFDIEQHVRSLVNAEASRSSKVYKRQRALNIAVATIRYINDCL